MYSTLYIHTQSVYVCCSTYGGCVRMNYAGVSTHQVKNLRSSVSRAAIACLGEMFALVGHFMEPVSLY